MKSYYPPLPGLETKEIAGQVAITRKSLVKLLHEKTDIRIDLDDYGFYILYPFGGRPVPEQKFRLFTSKEAGKIYMDTEDYEKFQDVIDNDNLERATIMKDGGLTGDQPDTIWDPESKKEYLNKEDYYAARKKNGQTKFPSEKRVREIWAKEDEERRKNR